MTLSINQCTTCLAQVHDHLALAGKPMHDKLVVLSKGIDLFAEPNRQHLDSLRNRAEVKCERESIIGKLC